VLAATWEPTGLFVPVAKSVSAVVSGAPLCLGRRGVVGWLGEIHLGKAVGRRGRAWLFLKPVRELASGVRLALLVGPCLCLAMWWGVQVRRVGPWIGEPFRGRVSKNGTEPRRDRRRRKGARGQTWRRCKTVLFS
jgi:hypothetical protein